MTAHFGRVAVLGLGLLGGSVALAARARGVARCVAGATRRSSVLDAALRRGAIDEAGSFEEAVRGAELVVLATPVHAMADVAARIAPALGEGTLVTDVGSVKAGLVETLPGLLPRGVTFVGSHPMAGGHQSGIEHARADLFAGAPCIVTGGAGAPGVVRVAAFWRALGARVLLRDPAEHDAQVAWVSHLPHLVAYAFARALEAAPPGARELAGPGFRDFTRIAQGDPELWADILTANRKALGAPVQKMAAALGELARLVEAGDGEGVERWLGAARTALAAPGDGRPDAAGENPRSSEGRAPGAGDCEPTHE